MICRAGHNNTGGMFDELIVDNFAGGGGASMGIEQAMGRAVDIAINHDPEAVAMHQVNHPATHHYCESVWDVDPEQVTGGRPVGLAWFSPDCKHFSKAKGGRPVEKKIRGLAWVVIRWAKRVRPRVIMLENVEEFKTWGPLTDDGMPCQKRKGDTFRSWVGELRKLGYAVEWRELRACDYGAPTIRKRLFLVARCDGRPIIWPEATHGDGVVADKRMASMTSQKDATRKRRDLAQPSTRHNEAAPVSGGRTHHLKPYRTAADCIDWSIPCPSIFERKRPLADNTLRRIAAGIKRYVIDSGDPYIVRIGQTGGNGAYSNDIETPLTTVTTKAEHLLVSPILASTNHGDSGGRRSYPMDEPMRTVCASSGGGEALVVPTLVQTGYGEREGQKPRVPGLEKPMGTVVAGGGKHALVSAFIAKHFGGMVGVEVDTPLPTTTARGTQNQVVTAHLMHNTTGHSGGRADEPLHTLTTGNHAGLVAALMVKYYGEGGQWAKCDDPMHTIPTKGRFGLVTVNIQGEPYVITDIGMRMLQPRELYRAQGFPDSYVIDPEYNGKPLTKTAQVRMCGNSVCPPMSRAMVETNMKPIEEEAVA